MTDKLSPTLPEAAQEAIDAIAGLTGTIPEDKLDALMAAYGSLRRAMHSLSASGDVERALEAFEETYQREAIVVLPEHFRGARRDAIRAALTASGNSGAVSDDLIGQLAGAKHIVAIADARIAELEAGLRQIAFSECGCSPICQCYTESSLRIWREEAQDKARALLNEGERS